MRRFGKSVVILTIVFSPIFIVGKPIVGRAEGDYYSILGLNPNSSPDEVLQAFYALSQQYNVDLTSDPNAQLRFQQIREAFEVLSNPEKRRQYDYQRVGGNFATTGNFGYPNLYAGDYPFGQQFQDGNGGNAFAWTTGNTGGANNFGWVGQNGWGAGNGLNNNNAWGTGNGMNNAIVWSQGGGNQAWGSGNGVFIGTAQGGAGGGGYGQPGGSVGGGGGSAWVVNGGQKGTTVWAAGGNGSSTGVGGNGAAVAVSGGGDVSYESYTLNGCTTVTQRNGDSVSQYTTCE